MELRDSLSRSQHRERTLSLQLQNARLVNQGLLHDFITVSEREADLRANVGKTEGRVLAAEIDAQMYQTELGRFQGQNGHLIELLALGCRVVERLEKQHNAELGLVEAGVRAATVVKARQPWIEAEKARFMADCKNIFGEGMQREILLAYIPNAPSKDPTPPTTPNVLFPSNSTAVLPAPPMTSPPRTTPNQIGQRNGRNHARKPTDYDGILRHILGAEEAKEFIVPHLPNGEIA